MESDLPEPMIEDRSHTQCLVSGAHSGRRKWGHADLCIDRTAKSKRLLMLANPLATCSEVTVLAHGVRDRFLFFGGTGKLLSQAMVVVLLRWLLRRPDFFLDFGGSTRVVR